MGFDAAQRGIEAHATGRDRSPPRTASTWSGYWIGSHRLPRCSTTSGNASSRTCWRRSVASRTGPRCRHCGNGTMCGWPARNLSGSAGRDMMGATWTAAAPGSHRNPCGNRRAGAWEPRRARGQRRWPAPMLLGMLLLPSAVDAHEVRPAYLQVTEVSAGRFEVLWKQPILPDADPGLVRRLPLEPRFPSHCREGERALPDLTATALLERWTLTCGEAGLPGAEDRRRRPAAHPDGRPAARAPAGRDIRRSPAPLGGAAGPAVARVERRDGGSHLPAAGHRAPALRLRSHPVRRGPALLRATPSAARAGGDGVHRGTQLHA